jgi:hypothetical protein
MLTVLVTSITCGYAVFVAAQGISHRGELPLLHTRAEVHDKFEKPGDTRTCPDGRVVESWWIRKKVIGADDPAPGTAERYRREVKRGEAVC